MIISAIGIKTEGFKAALPQHSHGLITDKCRTLYPGLGLIFVSYLTFIPTHIYISLIKETCSPAKKKEILFSRYSLSLGITHSNSFVIDVF